MPQSLCDCPPIVSEAPLSTINATLLPSATGADGVIADVIVPLSGSPEYRPDFNVCNRRRVCVTVTPTLTGGSAPQPVQLILGAVYDAAPGSYYPITDFTPSIVTVPAGGTITPTLSGCTDLDANRFLYVAVAYVAGATPAPGAGVTYTPPVAPATNVTVTIFPSTRYPTRRITAPVYGVPDSGYGYGSSYGDCDKDDHHRDYYYKKDDCDPCKKRYDRHHKKDDCNSCKKSSRYH